MHIHFTYKKFFGACISLLLIFILFCGCAKKDPSEDYKHYEAVPEWAKVSLKDRAIQIDDVLYVPGVTASELMSKLLSSEVYYLSDYNAESVLAPRESKRINVYRDETEWFVFYIVNNSDEIQMIGDCIVKIIMNYPPANDFCRFIDGRSYSDILSLSFEDVQALDENILTGYRRNITDLFGPLQVAFYSQDKDNILMCADGTAVKVHNDYWFTIDKDTGKVSNFKIENISFITEVF